MASTKKGIENFITGSIIEIRPMSIDKLQGLRTKVATVDEWLSGDLRENPIGAIKQGSAKIDDYIILATSSEGTVRNGCGDDIKMELRDILKGEYKDDHVSIWWYKVYDPLISAGCTPLFFFMSSFINSGVRPADFGRVYTQDG